MAWGLLNQSLHASRLSGSFLAILRGVWSISRSPTLHHLILVAKIDILRKPWKCCQTAEVVPNLSSQGVEQGMKTSYRDQDKECQMHLYPVRYQWSKSFSTGRRKSMAPPKQRFGFGPTYPAPHLQPRIPLMTRCRPRRSPWAQGLGKGIGQSLAQNYGKTGSCPLASQGQSNCVPWQVATEQHGRGPDRSPTPRE